VEEDLRLEQIRETMRAFDQAEMAQARMVDLSRDTSMAPNGKGRRNPS
jgi:hypothetical protein